MPDFTTLIPRLLQGGLGNLASYLAAHVLLCLLPAFYIAGAMTAMIPKPTITRFLGRGTPRFVSYPAAALAGSVLAVCSCTIVPLFAGIHRKGAGIGPAVTFLFFAPAANILALVYTGNIIGPDLAVARLLLSLAFGIGIGLIMALLFHDDDAAHDRATDALFAAQAERGLSRGSLAFMLLWVALLLAGTLKLGFLTDAWASLHLPLHGAGDLQSLLEQLVPFDAQRGEEGVSVQGAVLILLLVAVGFASWRGFEHIQEGYNRWTGTALALTAATLLIAALRVDAGPSGLTVGFTGRFVGVLAAQLALLWLARSRIGDEELRDWLWESWRFVKQIFPLLVAGVFVVGVLRVVIRPEWIEALAGANTLVGEPGRRGLRRVHVLPDPRRGADRADVPRPRHAPRAVARLPDGGPGTEPAEHPDPDGHPRPAQDVDLRGAGGVVQRDRRPGLWRVGRRRQPVVDRGAGGRVPRRAVGGTVAGQRAPGPQTRLSRHSGSGEESTC